MSVHVALPVLSISLNFLAIVSISIFSTIFILAQVFKPTPRVLVINVTTALFGRTVCGFARAVLSTYAVKTFSHSSNSLFELVDDSFYVVVVASMLLALIERIVVLCGQRWILKSVPIMLGFTLLAKTPLFIAFYVHYWKVENLYLRDDMLLYMSVAMILLTIVVAVLLQFNKRRLVKLSERQVSLRYEIANSIRNTQPLLGVSAFLIVVLSLQQTISSQYTFKCAKLVMGSYCAQTIDLVELTIVVVAGKQVLACYQLQPAEESSPSSDQPLSALVPVVSVARGRSHLSSFALLRGSPPPPPPLAAARIVFGRSIRWLVTPRSSCQRVRSHSACLRAFATAACLNAAPNALSLAAPTNNASFSKPVATHHTHHTQRERGRRGVFFVGFSLRTVAFSAHVAVVVDSSCSASHWQPQGIPLITTPPSWSKHICNRFNNRVVDFGELKKKVWIRGPQHPLHPLPSELDNLLFALYTNLFPLVFTFNCPLVLKHFPSMRHWVAKKTKAKLHPAYRYDSTVWAVGSEVHALSISSSQGTMDEDYCHQAFLAQTNWIFITIHVIVVLLNVVGISFMTVLLISVIRSRNECDFLSYKLQCLIVSVYGIAFNLSAFASLLASALERIYACFRSKVYERSRNPFIGVVSTALSWSSIVWLTLRFTHGDDYDYLKTEQTRYCNSQSIITETGFPFGSQLVLVVLIAVVVYIGLYLYTRKRKRHFSSENLSHRYQIVENLRSTQVIVPVAMGILIPTVISIAESIALYYSRVDLVQFAIYKELASLSTPIYVVCFPLIFVHMCPELVRVWRKQNTAVVSVSHLNYGSSQTYFRQLESMWEAMEAVDVALCEKAHSISGDSVFIGIQWFRVIVSTFACLCSLSSIVVVVKAKLYHSDLRVLIVNGNLPCIAYCALVAYRSAVYIHVYYHAQDACAFLSEKYTCGVQMASAAALYQTCISSMLVVAVERSIATCRSRTYEYGSSPIRTTVLALGSWWQTYFTLIFYLTHEREPLTAVVYCSSQSIGSYSFNLFNYTLLPMLGVTTFVYAVLYYYNHKMNKVYHSSPRNLSHGYQLYENVHTTRTVLISASILLALTMVNFATALIAAGVGASAFTFAIIKELTNVVIAFYSIAGLVQLALTRLLRHRKPRVHLQADNVHNYSTSADYFQKLNDYWMSRASEKVARKKNKKIRS
uniref:G_PROTEIN_RECEP_F1_2 domain-containing protein n=1 Tax=Steinernema glaseri TaxID=37863 RepID=A0A1I7ZXY6_9BILA